MIDAQAAKQLTEATSTPGVVHPLPPSALPRQLQTMPGAVSYWVSGSTASQVVAPGLTVGGELVVVRTEGQTAKAYNFVFATSAEGLVVYNGPYKAFAEHHYSSTQSVNVESLFNHHPFKKP